MDVKLDGTLRATFGTATFATGAATNADSTPTCVVLEQGTAMAYAPTCTNKATGLYELAIDCTAANGFEVGKEYSAYVVVVMGGVTARGPVPGVSSFTVRATSSDDVPSAASIAAAVLAATVHTGYSVARMFRLIGGAVAGKLSGVATNAPAFRYVDDSGDAITGTTTADGRTSVTHGS